MADRRVITHVVAGMGEVGTAIKTVLTDPDPSASIVHEIWPTDYKLWGSPPHYPERTDALHICFPHDDAAAFRAEVERYQAKYQPTDTIIHSTVPVGTSRLLGATFSPVSGRHPNLVNDLYTFTKFFGGPNYAAALRTSFHFKVCGIRTAAVAASEDCEAGKLLATLQFGWLVALQKEAKLFCDAVDADYEIAYEAFNRMYNAGMERVGNDLRLPVLRDMPGPIGGHCVIPNASLIAGHHPLALELLVLNGRWIDLVESKESPEPVR